MASLCPALRAAPQLGVASATLSEIRAALVAEVTGGLRDTPAGIEPTPFGTALGLDVPGPGLGGSPSLQSFPAFAVTPLPDIFSKPGSAEAEFAPAEPVQATKELVDQGEIVEWEDVLSRGTQEELEKEKQEMDEQKRANLRWYNAVSRRPFRNVLSPYADFDASATFARNRRGALVADALCGVGGLWRMAVKEAGKDVKSALKPLVLPLSPAEAELVDAAAPVLRGAIHGLTAVQLSACAEVIAVRTLSGPMTVEGSTEPVDIPDHSATMRCILQEAVRKHVNFSVHDLRRLVKAASACGVKDMWLKRAQERRFPKSTAPSRRSESAQPVEEADGAKETAQVSAN